MATPGRPGADALAVDNIRFAAEVEAALAEVAQSDDALDNPDFNVVDYVNKMLPNEQALLNIDAVIPKLQIKMRRLDLEIREAIHRQATIADEGRVALGESQKAIKELMGRIGDIRAKAEVSERMVQEITSDIKTLDYAKRHLTASINTLNHMHMLIGGVETLRDMTARRQYRDAANLLHAVVNIMAEFDAYRGIPKMRDISDEVNKVKLALKSQIRADFDDSFTGKEPTGETQHLREACAVIEVLGPDAKQELMDWFVRVQLADYRSVFPDGQEVSSLEKIDRRYAWAKRTVASYEENCKDVFPNSWHMSEAIFTQFCTWMRKDLLALLAARRETLDVKSLLQALQKTVTFEKHLATRFAAGPPAEGKSKPQSKFTRMLSSCFEPYMSIYIEAQERTLAEMIESFTREARAAHKEIMDRQGEDITANGPAKVLPSSSELFLFFKNCMVQCSSMSTKDPLWQLYKVFATYLKLYAARVLTGTMPRGADSRLSRKEEFIVCSILNTAEYCLETTAQLEAKLKEKIDPSYRDRVTLSEQQDAFLEVITSSLQALNKSLETTYDEVCNALARRQWANLTSVGDTSEYVSVLTVALKHSVPVVRNGVATKYFNNYCMKAVSSFIPRYLTALYKCRNVSTVAAEQLLLDAHAMKELILNMHSLELENSISAPSGFTKYVNKGMSKAEMTLKVVMSPMEPPKNFVQNFLALMPETDVGAFQKVIAMKSMRKTEEQQLLEEYAKETGTACVMASAGGSANTSVERKATSSATGARAAERLADIVSGESMRLKRLEDFMASKMP